jgi:hypothetical protein
MPEFKALRLAVEAWARSILEESNPNYVETLRRRLAEPRPDVEKVLAETRQLLEPDAPWHDVMIALFDVEYWMDRCRQAVQFIGSVPRGRGRTANPGVWLAYHADSWLLFAYGLLDRIRKLITAVCRHVIRDNKEAPKWKIVETALVGDVDKLKAVIEGMRDPIAHGGGIVEVLKKDKLLEPYIVLGGDEPDASSDIDIFASYYDGIASRQATWHAGVHGGTARIFAISEALFKKLRQEAFS